MTRRARLVSLPAAAVAALVTSALAGQPPAGGDDLRGTVRGPAGPEAGVWVIAETDDLDTGFRKIVVTGDDGRFLVPDLPEASYRVWVRGYGLVDSDPVTAEPGQTLALEAVPAASPQEAARVYPANYWYSLLEPPAADEFPGTGAAGNGIARGCAARPRGSTSPSRAASSVTRWATGSRSTWATSTGSTRRPTPGRIG